MTTAIAILVLVLILGGAIGYIVKSKKKGVKCIGCPMAGSCTSCSGKEEAAKALQQYVDGKKDINKDN